MTWSGISLLVNFFPEASLFILHEAFPWKLDLVGQEIRGNKAKLRLLLVSHLKGKKVTHNACHLLHLAVRASSKSQMCWKMEEDGACSGWGRDYQWAWGRSPKQDTAEGRAKGKSHETINRPTKREKLSGCTFAWPTEDVTYNQCVSPISSKELPNSPRSSAPMASFLSRCCTEQCLSPPWQLLSDGTGADGSSDHRACIALCCCSTNSLISKARSYPVTALSVGSRWTANTLQLSSAGCVPVCSGKWSSAAQPCPCCTHGGSWANKGDVPSWLH